MDKPKKDNIEVQQLVNMQNGNSCFAQELARQRVSESDLAICTAQDSYSSSKRRSQFGDGLYMVDRKIAQSWLDGLKIDRKPKNQSETFASEGGFTYTRVSDAYL